MIDRSETFTRLLEQHGGIIRKVAYSYTRTSADRHDLEQEITLQLWKAYPRYSAERSFSTWMYRIALNVAISFLRSNTRPVRQTVPLEEVQYEPAAQPSASTEHDERLADLQRVIAALDPLSRALLLLYLDEHSYREIGRDSRHHRDQRRDQIKPPETTCPERNDRHHTWRITMSATELDNLRNAWQTLGRKLDRQHALSLAQFKEARLKRFGHGFRWLAAGQILQVGCGVLLSVLSAVFWVNHSASAHLMIYGLLLQGYGLMMIVFAARDLFLIARIDYSAPVLEIQRQLAELRAWHYRTVIWFVVAGCFMWTPMLLILFYLAGADLWLSNRLYVYLNVLACFACLGCAYGLVWWSRRPGREKLARSLRESYAGRSVLQAQAALDEIEQFERE